jgi:hypothetical protein
MTDSTHGSSSSPWRPTSAEPRVRAYWLLARVARRTVRIAETLPPESDGVSSLLDLGVDLLDAAEALRAEGGR